MTRPIVLIESPFKDGDRQRNLRYLQWCMTDSAARGECPVASHAIGPLFWAEDDEHRELGKELHAALCAAASKAVLYCDLARTAGMTTWATGDHENRWLPLSRLLKFEDGELPPGTVELVARET